MHRFHRRSVRLKGYDYSQSGAYFVTLCTQNRQCLFGEIAAGRMRLNECGEIVENEWRKTAEIREEIRLDQYVVMPNHVHGVVFIENPVGANGRSPLRRTNMGSKSLSSFMAGYKSVVTKQINLMRKTPGFPVWQRNFYEHVIRTDEDLNRVREYIINNPVQWKEDEYFSITDGDS